MGRLSVAGVVLVATCCSAVAVPRAVCPIRPADLSRIRRFPSESRRQLYPVVRLFQPQRRAGHRRARADNSFAPDPGDRQQPTTFKPGHWRFQCVMVVDPKFDGKLAWKLTYAGTTTGTSQQMLQSNWNLVEGAAELEAHRLCQGTPRSVSESRADRAGARRDRWRRARRRADAGNHGGRVDEPVRQRQRRRTAAWRRPEGRVEAAEWPGVVKFSNPAAARTYASFSSPGTYELELWASDSVLENRTKVAVTAK